MRQRRGVWRGLSCLLALCMLLTLLPVSARAEGNSVSDKLAVSDNGNCVAAQGTPIVIKENGNIVSIYDEDDNLLSGDMDVSKKWIAGGWLGGAHEGDTYITLESGELERNIYGGNIDGTLTGDTSVTIEGGYAPFVYGGNESGALAGTTDVTINAGTVGLAYGGSMEGSVDTDADGLNVTINGGDVSYVFGGSYSGTVDGGTGVFIDETGSEDTLITNVYGGNWMGEVLYDTQVSVSGGTVYGDIFGGGYGFDEEGETVDGGTTAESTVGRLCTVSLSGGSVEGAVYGGGASEEATVYETKVMIDSGITLGRNVYGGGRGDVENICTVISDKASVSNGALYGGGYYSDVGGVDMTLDGGYYGAVYGGGDHGAVTGDVKVTLRDKLSPLHLGSQDTGLYINGGAGSTAVKNGVDSFVIGDGPLAHEMNGIYVVLPEGFESGSIATGAAESDLAKIHLTGPGAEGKTAAFDSASGTIVAQTASAAPDEQFTSLSVGGTYYFDLSGVTFPGPINAGYNDETDPDDYYLGLPDTTLKYIPFTYAGTVNAYSRTAAGVSTNQNVSVSDRSLFISDYNVTHTSSWVTLDNANLIFGTDYASGGVSYTLRAPSGGSSATGIVGDGNDDGANNRGVPNSNEWDQILDKGVNILNWYNMNTWVQDTQSTWDGGRIFRGGGSDRYFTFYGASQADSSFGYRPVLALPNDLNADALRTVTLDLNSKSFNGSNTLLLAVGKDSALTAPDKPSAIGDDFYGWNTAADGSGTNYAAAASVPSTVSTLYAQWDAPAITYTITFNANGGTVSPASGTTGADGRLSVLPTPTRNGGYRFDGWFKAENTPVTTETVFTADTEIFAHWTYTGGSDGGSSDSSHTTTEKKPDGSTTTTVTKPDGTVTETTKAPDGTKTVVETKKDGTVTETVNKPDGTKAETVTTAKGNQTYTEQRPDGTKISADSPKSGEATAKVTLPESVGATVVSFPVTDGTVVLRVLPDGTEEPVPFSLVVGGRVYIRLDGDAELKVETRAGLFDDMDGHWAEEPADFTGARELFEGTAPRNFAPEQPMTRTMLTTVLYRMDGAPDGAGGGAPFSDVDSGAWYASGVAWAVENGIASGTGGGLFGAGRSITRQELAVMLWNYAKYDGIDVSIGEDTNILSYADVGEAGEWAIPALRWACGAGIIDGTTDNRLAPRASATRAEAAAMLERFITLAVKSD